jgi:hypothetical protein
LFVVLDRGLHHFLEGHHLAAHAALYRSTFLDLALQMHLFAGLPQHQMAHLASPLTQNLPRSRSKRCLYPCPQRLIL